MKKLKIGANAGFFLAIGFFALSSCESEADSLGRQFVEDGAASGKEMSYDLVAYNINHNDSLRSDASRLTNALLGAFEEGVFGSQKASYVSQLRPASYNPDFGKNAKVDSVVMYLTPAHSTATDSIKTNTTDIAKNTADQDSIKTVTTYPITKYGKAKINGAPAPLTIKVKEVNDFLYDTSAKYFSNKTVSTGAELGSATVSNGSITGIVIKKKDDQTELVNINAAIRIRLDNNFFQNKIIAAQGSSALNDAASFIRYFKGIQLSVVENDGYLFNFAPEDVSIKMYYTHDVEKDNETTKKSDSYTFNLGTSNARFGQYSFNRPASFSSALSQIDPVNGDKKLYLQGTGGPGAEFKIPEATIQALKNLYSQSKIGIVSAKIRLYSAQDVWNNAFPKPETFTVLQKDVKSFIVDMTSLTNSGLYQRVFKGTPDEPSSDNEVYYDISITQTLKNIVESGADNHPIQINVGDFASTTSSSTGATTYTGWNYTTRAYTPNRLVLIGSDSSFPEKRAQLKVIYTHKN
ncbi:DUF4270 domain-containing protein [Elizabethkingia sp. JS20170427COW]|uniref:DUF4270 domain-containing protein n=1 Tax=Elizabethkingia sp. JS20170427COW TaxID=2583851 RepID=UPI001110F5AB|nr:DUF4270 domain-containing protein [Elizabethkingia sp. JS20170427COW]QCX53555.1 DUF4270 domain-containing protein [Elizabethkingia sp. JS20170427COW]